MQKGKKLISLLLSLIMVLSLVSTAAAYPADGTGELEITSFPKTTENEKSGVESTEIAFQDGSGKQALTGLNGHEVVQRELQTALGDTAGAPVARSAEEEYVEDVAAALAKPVGAVGIEELQPGAMVDIIVWLQQLPSVLAQAYGEAAADSLTAEYAEMGAQARRTIESSYGSAITYEYFAVFAGFAMTVKADAVQKIAAMPGVYAVTPDAPVYADEASYDPDYEYTGMLESRQIFDIAEIHAAGITGDNVVVGILDTGVDYNHPDLAGVFKGGYNYIAPASDYGRPAELLYDPMETTYAQWQSSARPETDSSGHTFYTDHGTHVSGIIAAGADNTAYPTYKALGLAPDVDLYVARVLGPYGTGATSGVIAAVEDFTVGNSSRGIPKADVINLSLGSDTNTAYGDNVYALNNAVIGGVNVAVSAGNNATGTATTMEARTVKTLGTPGTAYLPVTAAAAQYGGAAIKTYDGVSANLGGEASSTAFGLLIEGQSPDNAFGDDAITGSPAPVYVDGKGYEAYLAFGAGDTNPTLAELQAIPDGSLTGKILVVKRGLNFTDFQAQALRTGAGALIIVNHATGGEAYITNMVIGGIQASSLPIFSAFHSTSAKLTALAAGGNKVYLQLGDMTTTHQAQLPAYFSSIGPVNPTVGLKPDLIAPGWNIVSTAPAYITSPTHDATDYSAAYQLMSGTSMSAPHITGILALMAQAYPDASPAEIKARLMNTALPDLIDALEDGTPASVLEVGAGFVNPSRAILGETNDVYVTVTDDIPGASSGTVIANQTLSSLSFGEAPQGGLSRELPVTVHGTTDFTLRVVYNNDTRYSKDAADNGVELKYSTPAGGTFDVWVDVPAEAEEGYYEGRLVVTADGHEYSLPWLVQVGEPEQGGEFDLLFTSERPIISTSTNTNIRSANGTAPLNSNSTTLYFTWMGAWPTDSSGYSDLDLYLVNAESMTLDYYYGYVTIGGLENDGTALYRVANFISNTAYDTATLQRVPIANGVYYPCVYANDTFYFFDEVGVAYTDGTGDYAVQLSMEPTITVNPDTSVTSATIEGRIYSLALEQAANAGFYWTEVDDFWYFGEMYEIDQTFNVLGYSTTGSVYASGSSGYNLYMSAGNPWICDEEGYFSLTMNVTQANKNGGYPFTSGTNHTVVGVEGFYYNDNGSSWPLIGANKSAAITPRYALGPWVESVTADNGSIVANISNLPTNAALADFSAEYSVNGGAFAALPLSAMSVSGSNVTLSFAPYAAMSYAQAVTVRLTYTYNTATAEPFTVEPVGIESVVADNDTGTLRITFDEIPANSPAESEFTITWGTGYAPADADQALTDYAYDPATGAATFRFTPYTPFDWDQSVTFHVTFNGVTSDSNTINIPGTIPSIEIRYYNAGAVSVQLGKKATLEILTDPEVDLSLYTITWTSANSAVASVNSEGVVTGRKRGQTTITATILNPYGQVATLPFVVTVY